MDDWRKSSHSGSNGGQYVEVASVWKRVPRALALPDTRCEPIIW
jgi:Domain of unknown function (DUF397)